MSRNKKKSLLWRIENNQGHIAYLFGSIHIATENLLSDFERLYEYILSVDNYYAETNLDEMMASQNDEVNFSKGLVGDILTQKKIEKLYKLVSPYGMEYHELVNKHAFSVYQFVMGIAFSNIKVIYPDHLLWDFAKENGKKLDGVEDLALQLDISENYDKKELKKMLKKAIDKPFGMVKELDKMLKLYKKQDTHQLQKNTKKALGNMRKVLVYDRNIMMTKRIDEILRTDRSSFIAVGGGHLGGKTGILAGLKNKDYKIEPIKW